MPKVSEKNLRQVTIIGRCRGSEQNVFVCVADKYDMSVYVDYLRRMEDNTCPADYLIIEPYQMKDLFSEF